MKNYTKVGIAVLVFFALMPYERLFAQEIKADSRIASVTVYPDSSLISRRASLKLEPGEHEIIFDNIIPEVDENSIRVSSENAAGALKILGAQLKREFLKEEADEKVKQLKQEIEKLEDNIKKLENDKQTLSEEKDFLDSIRLFSKEELPKDLVTKVPSAKELEDTLKFLGVKLRENFTLLRNAELEIREGQKKINVLNRQLQEISGPQMKTKRSIKVSVEVLKPQNLDLTVSYLVYGASWQPIYNARADFDKSEVELISYGIIQQATGEDWDNVEISLSTAKPAISGKMPYVEPWFLKPYQPRAEKDKGLSIMAMDAGARRKQYQALEEVMPNAPQPAYSQVEEKGVAVVYKLAKKATIKSDGTEHKLPISTQVLQAKFDYSSYPRAVLNAYLGSRVKNAPALQLLAGRVNIFLEGDFVGISGIDNIGPEEEFDLYLGADENVKVKREQIEKKVDETLIAGIPSPTKRTTFKYKLTVENYKSKKIRVKLFEAMPVSQDERIKVKIDKVSLEPKEKDFEDRLGVWLWELELEPKDKKEIFYTFIVEHPRQMSIEGL